MERDGAGWARGSWSWSWSCSLGLVMVGRRGDVGEGSDGFGKGDVR